MDFGYLTAHFWSWQIGVVLGLYAIVQCMTIGGYAARLAGVRSGRIATSMSFFNVFVMASRMASLLYAPLLGSLSDAAARHTLAHDTLRAPALWTFQWQLRAVVVAGTIGAAIGTLFIPTFARWFLRGIASFERSRSLPYVLGKLAYPRAFFSAMREVRLPKALLDGRLSFRNLPKSLLLINILVTSIYAIGVVAATYASVINPSTARTALFSSGFVNGLAMICYTLVVDPGSAYIVDQAARGERAVDDVRSLVLCLALTSILGMLLGQLLLLPAAGVITFVARLLAGH